MDYIVKVYKDWKLHSQFTEIVPDDMDDDYIFNEKQSIRESGRTLKKYGSTCNHIRNNEILIRHEIEKTDTLQGIALKYGCSTEQIRRANRLFASDSLFLRQYLLIPVDKTSPYYPKDDRPQSFPSRSFSIAGTDPITDPADIFQQQQQQSNHNRNQSKSMDSMTTTTTSTSATMSPEEENRKSMDEFLGKIDSTIAQSRQYVVQCSNSDLINHHDDDDIFRTTNSTGDMDRRHRQNNHSTTSSTSSTSYKFNSQHIRHSSSGSTSDTAQLLNITHGRRVQNSLQRLEKQQDEFFEL